MSFSKSSLAAHKAISTIYLMVSKIYLYRFMRLNIDQITVYQSLFISKANVNRGSRNGMTCSEFFTVQSEYNNSEKQYKFVRRWKTKQFSAKSIIANSAINNSQRPKAVLCIKRLIKALSNAAFVIDNTPD